MPSSNGDDRGSPPPAAGDPPEGASILLGHVRRLGQEPPHPESYQYVYRAYYRRVEKFFAHRGYRPEEASDLTQDTFVRVYGGRGAFESIDAFNGWLFKIAINVHRNEQRARHAAKRDKPEDSLEQRLEEQGWEPDDTDAGWSESPLEQCLVRERQAVAAGALRDLPPKMRQCYLLSLQGPWTYREIGNLLGIAEGTVKAHIHQARRRVLERLEGYFRGPGGRDPEEDGS